MAVAPRVERRPRRDRDPRNDVGIGVHLRPQEIKALSEVGRFRVVAVRDLAEIAYGGDRSALERDLGYLEKKGIVTFRSVNARRDGSWRQPERIQIVTLTRPGKKIVRQVGTLRHDQQLYAGLVKPREVEHDTQVYRAYLKEMERIESLGGSNPRVVLDFEIKCNVQRALYAQRKADPDREVNEIKGRSPTFRDTLHLSLDKLPGLDLVTPTAGKHRCYFADRFPILILPETEKQPRRISFCFVDDGIETLGPLWRFLLRHEHGVRSLPGSEIVYVAETRRHFLDAGRMLSRAFPKLGATTFAARECPRGVRHFLTYLEARQVFEEALVSPTVEQSRILTEGRSVYKTAVSRSSV